MFLTSCHQSLNNLSTCKLICNDKSLAIPDDLGGDDADLGLPDVLPDGWWLVGGSVEAEDLGEGEALGVDDGEAVEAAGLEGHHFGEGWAAVH